MLGNFIVETCNAPGTGAMTPGGAIPGRIGFVQYFGNGAPCYYVLTDGVSEEFGSTTAGASMPRNVIWTSAGGTAPLNFTGTCQIYNMLPAQRAMFGDVNGNFNARGGVLFSLGAAGYADQAPRLDQVGMVRTKTVGITNGAFLLPVPAVPGGGSSQLLTIDLKGVTTGPSNIGYYLRFSDDNGNTYISGANDYRYGLATATDGASNEYNGLISYAPFTATLDHNSAMTAEITIDPTTRQWMSRAVGINGYNGKYVFSSGSGNAVSGGPPTHILISAIGQNLTAGQARISQKVF